MVEDAKDQPGTTDPGSDDASKPAVIPPVQTDIFETDQELSGTYRLPSLPGSPSTTVNAKRAIDGLGGRPLFFRHTVDWLSRIPIRSRSCILRGEPGHSHLIA